MSASGTKVDRRVLRRNEPAALATVLVGQLSAYRCSTVYAPSNIKFAAFITQEVLPRISEDLDARIVVIDRWDKRAGPTLGQLVSALQAQLELAPVDLELEPRAALAAVLRQAERRSERPIFMVLHRLELLLDRGRDAGEVASFVDALGWMSSLPMSGLHLVLGVKEVDLGAFRDLLRGHWRLLANDIRIRPRSKLWLLSLPLLLLAQASAGPGLIAGAAALGVGTGAVVGAVVGSHDPESCEEETLEVAALRRQVAELRRQLDACTDPQPDADTEDAETTTSATSTTATTRTTSDPANLGAQTGEETATSDGTTTGGTSSATEGPTTSSTSGDELAPANDPAKVQAAKVQAAKVQAAKADMCEPSTRDGKCGACVRAQCCTALKSCKKAKWRRCVLRGKIGTGTCTPEAVETDCRKLALCALENTCRAECFNH